MYRLKLELQRRLLIRLPFLRSTPSGEVSPHSKRPSALFTPRLSAGAENGTTLEALFLNLRWPLASPMNWHPKALQLEVMNLHYMEYLEALKDDTVRALISDWIEQNPPYGPRYWHDHWNSYALSIRCVVWMQQAEARQFDLKDTWGKRFLASLVEQLTFLSHHLELDIKGNHLIKNIKALLWGSAYFAGPESERWKRLAHRLLQKELEEQILSDGVHFERSPAYHAQVFADLLESLSLLTPGDLRNSLISHLARMAQALTDLSHPDGLLSQFNDGGLHMAYSPSECLTVYTRLTGQCPAARPSFDLREAGYFGLRNAESLVLIDCGPIAPDSLPAHGHGDMLAFEWSIQGQRLIVDTGVFEYVESPARVRSRSTPAHNTVSLDDMDQCEFWGSFRVGRRGRGRLEKFESSECEIEFIGTQDGYRHLPGGPIHRRRIKANSSGIEVWDWIERGRGQKAKAHLLLHPEVSVEPFAGGLLLRTREVIVKLRTLHPTTILHAPWYPDFGVSIETSQIVLDYGSAPCHGTFSLEVLSSDSDGHLPQVR